MKGKLNTMSGEKGIINITKTVNEDEIQNTGRENGLCIEKGETCLERRESW